MSDDAGGKSALSEGLGSIRPLVVVYDKTEGLLDSVLSDAATFFGLVFCMWFSHALGGASVWQFVTLVMFLLWSFVKMPWERMTGRVVKMHSKREAQAWAASLPDDAA